MVTSDGEALHVVLSVGVRGEAELPRVGVQSSVQARRDV